MAVRYTANAEYLQQTDLVTACNYNNAYTLMVWYYPVATHATVNLGFLWMSNTAITAYDAIGQGSVSNGSQLYIVDNVSGLDYSAGAITDGVWNHIAMVRTNSALLQGFLNGEQFATNRTGSVAARAAATRTWIGSPSGSYYISARFAHAKLWRVGLSPEDIQREMWSIAPATNLRDVVTWWPLMSDNRKLGVNGYPWTEVGTLSDEADPEIAWRIAPPRPMFWWIPIWGAISVSDSTTVGESVSLSVSTAQIAVADASTVGEAVALSVIDSTRLVSVADAVSASEALAIQVGTAAVVAADGVTVGESVSVAASTAQIAVSDSATVGESVSLKPQTQIAKSESTTVGESVSLKPQTQIAKSDSATVGESVALSVIDSTRLVTAADASTVGESVAVSVSTAQITAADSATVGEAASVRIVQSVALSVSAGSDDGFWNSGTFNNGAVYVSLGSGYSLFARWLLTIPQNSTIWHAHIDLYNVGYSFAGSLNTSIVAHDDDAPAAPTTDAEAASATRTTASAAWSVPVADQAAVGTTIQTADFATVIQELVDSYDYSSGSPAVVFIDHVSGSAIDLWLYSRDGSSTLAPKLHIGYTTTTQFITVADSVTVAEAIGLHVLSHVAVADSATVGESVSLAVANPQIAKSDSATVGEVVSLAVAAPQITAADSAAVSEAIGLHELSHVVTADASTVGDAATLAVSEPAIIVADASTVDESVAIIRELVDVRQFSTSDAVAAAESNAVTVSDPQIVVGDASTVADFATVAFNHQVTAADASIVAESHAVTVSDPQIVTADASTVADFATVAFNHEVATTDAVGVTDFSTVTISVLQITVTDGVTVTDVCAVEISALQITVADGVTVAETVTLHAIFFISVTDAASVAESYTLPPPLLSLTVSDAASVADSFTGYPAQLLLQSADAITVGDTIAMFVIILHGLVDVTLTDSAAYNATLADGALYSAVITDRTRTEGIS